MKKIFVVAPHARKLRILAENQFFHCKKSGCLSPSGRGNGPNSNSLNYKLQQQHYIFLNFFLSIVLAIEKRNTPAIGASEKICSFRYKIRMKMDRLRCR